MQYYFSSLQQILRCERIVKARERITKRMSKCYRYLDKLWAFPACCTDVLEACCLYLLRIYLPPAYWAWQLFVSQFRKRYFTLLPSASYIKFSMHHIYISCTSRRLHGFLSVYLPGSLTWLVCIVWHCNAMFGKGLFKKEYSPLFLTSWGEWVDKTFSVHNPEYTYTKRCQKSAPQWSYQIESNALPQNCNFTPTRCRLHPLHLCEQWQKVGSDEKI